MGFNETHDVLPVLRVLRVCCFSQLLSEIEVISTNNTFISQAVAGFSDLLLLFLTLSELKGVAPRHE